MKRPATVETRCPMRHAGHRITDRDGVISCILCHKTWERTDPPVATWDFYGWASE